jgi:hypothetical protein
MQDALTTRDLGPPPAAALAPPQLPLLRLELTFVMDEPALLPPFRGNLWRGVLGPALKRIDEGLFPGLPTGQIAPGTLYRTFFETPPPPDATRMRLYESVPHPYVVDAPGQPGFRRLEAGAEEHVGLTLVGRAATAAEAVLTAFDFAARAGIGAPVGSERARERGRARLASARAVWRGAREPVAVYDGAEYRGVAAVEPPLPPAPDWLRVILATPLRIVHDGRLVGPKGFRPAALLANLVRRVSMMTAFHTDTPLNTDFRHLKQLWEELNALQPMLAAAEGTRWSGAQRRELDMTGIVGSFVLDLRGAKALFPYLWLGQWLHAGKGAVMGMGAIRLKPEPETG